MLWAVRNEWPSGAQFTFNFCHHWDTLVVHDTEDGSGHFLHSKEGVTQGGGISHDRIRYRVPPSQERAIGRTSLRHPTMVRG